MHLNPPRGHVNPPRGHANHPRRAYILGRNNIYSNICYNITYCVHMYMYMYIYIYIYIYIYALRPQIRRIGGPALLWPLERAAGRLTNIIIAILLIILVILVIARIINNTIDMNG